jgi:hypothetical protein
VAHCCLAPTATCLQPPRVSIARVAAQAPDWPPYAFACCVSVQPFAAFPDFSHPLSPKVPIPGRDAGPAADATFLLTSLMPPSVFRHLVSFRSAARAGVNLSMIGSLWLCCVMAGVPGDPPVVPCPASEFCHCRTSRFPSARTCTCTCWLTCVLEPQTRVGLCEERRWDEWVGARSRYSRSGCCW